jgi:polysaccharide deacetylase family protein (PEP-CTERM system associated)
MGGSLAQSERMRGASPLSIAARVRPGTVVLRPERRDVVNAMTIDVEDYFQVSAFEQHLSRDNWDGMESRVCRNTDRLLEMFAQAGVRGTFFVLGWVAERHPSLVRRIAAAGHEIASHGHEHRLVYEQTPAEFAADLKRSRAVLEDASGQMVIGYRAPSYSITRRSLWALDVLIEHGYTYDASIYPIHHDRYGIPDAPRHIHRIDRAGGHIWELPGSTTRLGGANLPIGGGGYFRLLPYAWTRRGIDRLNTVEREPAIFYLHPWEVDPAQPRMKVGAVSRFRHYRNLDQTEKRLRQLLQEFRFAPAGEVLGATASVQLASAVA